MYQSCVLSILLYGSECWKMTESDLNKLSTVRTKHLRRSLWIFWPEPSPTSSLPLQPRQHGHHHHTKAMEMDQTCDEKRARQHLQHRPSPDTREDSKRKRWRPKPNTWRRTVEGELKTIHHTWWTVQNWSRTDRSGLPLIIAALHVRKAYRSVGVRRTDNLSDLLVRSKLHTVKQTNLTKGSFWCGNNCIACPYIADGRTNYTFLPLVKWEPFMIICISTEILKILFPWYIVYVATNST